MKLLIIVLSLLSERYLTHAISHRRFDWFRGYFKAIHSFFPKKGGLANPWLILVSVILPLLIVTGIILWLFQSVLFGFISFLINLVIFYYCLGPDNVFYPATHSEPKKKTKTQGADRSASEYFADVNSQLFTVIFWYILLGPLAIILYRLVSLCQLEKIVSAIAKFVTDIIEWIPARITAIVYLLVGNFQRGFGQLLKKLFAAPSENHTLLSQVGIAAVRTGEKRDVTLPFAQILVEHAIIVYLVLLALFTMVSWL